MAIKGCNLYPKWGLHNNATGIVKEIVFQANKNPNNGHFPEYVVVHFNNLKLPKCVQNGCSKKVSNTKYYQIMRYF